MLKLMPMHASKIFGGISKSTIVMFLVAAVAVAGDAPTQTAQQSKTSSVLASEVDRGADLQSLVAEPRAEASYNDTRSELGKSLAQKQEQLNALIARLNELNETQLEDAVAVTETGIAIAGEIESLLVDGGPLDEALRKAHAKFGYMRELIIDDPSLSEKQRTHLLGIMSHRSEQLAQDRAAIDALKGSVVIRLEELQNSRNYLSFLVMVNASEGVLAAIGEAIDVLRGMLDLLDSVGTADSAPSS